MVVTELKEGINKLIRQHKPSIIESLSPAEMVKVSAKTSFGIQGYEIKTADQLKKAESYSMFKSKAPGPIAGEADYRKQFPGSGQYNSPFDKPWDQQLFAKHQHADFGKAPRQTPTDLIEKLTSKKETSTPSAVHYKFDKIKLLPRLGIGVVQL